MSETEQLILLGAYSALAAAKTLDLTGILPRHEGGLALHQARADAKQDAVLLDLADWLGSGSLDAAQRKAASRALERLDAAGLLLRCYWGPSKSRCTHVIITATGFALVDELLKDHPPSVHHATVPDLVAPDEDLRNPLTRGEG